MNNVLLKSIGLLVLGIFLGLYVLPRPFVSQNAHFYKMGMDGKRGEFLSEKDDIMGEMMGMGGYRCCLEKPCVYCIEKTPGHGIEASCSCLDDIMNGVHPCGECIGEILEGHGNKFLSKYFARAIIEEVGENHTLSIKQIISEKYGISVEDQI